MNAYKIIITGVIVLCLNNLVLLAIMGYFDDKERVTESIDSRPFPISNQASAQQTKPEVTASSALRNGLETMESDELALQIERAIEDYMLSEELTVTLDDWAQGRNQRYRELNARFTNMDVFELYQFINNAEDANERSSALNYLLQSSKLKQLSNDELKHAYGLATDHVWGKTKLLEVLLEKGDEQALVWAKASISENNSTNRYGFDMYSTVYQQDSEFIKSHLESLELDLESPNLGLFTFLAQEPEVAKPFYIRNLDKILDSNSDEIFSYASSISGVELSSSQQSKVIDLFSSSNRNKRHFAINLATQIKDTDVLRSAYTTLDRSQEKMIFIAQLVNSIDNPEAAALARELASNSDNPQIRRFATQNPNY